MNGNDAICLAHRVCAKVRHGPLGRCFIFLCCTLCGVVNCVLSTVGAHDRDDESTIRIKKGDALGLEPYIDTYSWETSVQVPKSWSLSDRCWPEALPVSKDIPNDVAAEMPMILRQVICVPP